MNAQNQTEAASAESAEFIQMKYAATGDLYHVRNDAKSRRVAADQLAARVKQLDAMLTIIIGEGHEAFETWNDDIRHNYLWACSSIAGEIRELLRIVG